MEVMIEGDYWGKPFNFPKPEISIEPDFMNEREEFNRAHPDLPTFRDLYLMTFELASKFGTPYYDNQLPAYRGAGKGISCYQCCAYQFSAVADKDSDFDKKLIFKDGKHFSMGSWQVVSVNCPRAAYKAEGSDERLFAELRALMDVASRALQDQAPVDEQYPGERPDAVCDAAAKGPEHRRARGDCGRPRRARVHDRRGGGQRDGPAPHRYSRSTSQRPRSNLPSVR